MGQKPTIKGKIIFKHQTAEEWERSSYIPAVGERVLYVSNTAPPSVVGEKFGNGKNYVKDLPFTSLGGKSAYEYAVEGGYEGSEEEFTTTFASVLMGGGSSPAYNQLYTIE